MTLCIRRSIIALIGIAVLTIGIQSNAQAQVCKQAYQDEIKDQRTKTWKMRRLAGASSGIGILTARVLWAAEVSRGAQIASGVGAAGALLSLSASATTTTQQKQTKRGSDLLSEAYMGAGIELARMTFHLKKLDPKVTEADVIKEIKDLDSKSQLCTNGVMSYNDIKQELEKRLIP